MRSTDDQHRRSTIHPVRRAAVRGIAVAALAIGSLALAPEAAPAAAAPCWPDALTDLDGGGPDVVVGLPSYDLPGKPDAGAVVVFSNVGAPGASNPKAPTARRLLTANSFPGLSAQAGARFGGAVALWRDGGDFDDPDACADLLVGAPGTTVGGLAGAGQVYLLGGSSTAGLHDVRQVFDEATLTGVGGAQAGAHFGASLATETLSVIAIGAPGRDVGTAVDAGRVDRLDYRLSDTPPDVTVVQQGGDNNAGAPESGDRFGEALDVMPTGDGPVLVIGIPHEDIGSKVDAGAVGMLPNIGNLTLASQDTAGAAGTAEAGDRFGAGVDGYFTFDDHQAVGVLAVGVPGEDVGSTKDAGLISVLTFGLGSVPEEGVTPLQGNAVTVTQDTANVPGTVEAGDAFGTSVVTGEFGTDNGDRHLVVGAPREDLGAVKDGGRVTMSRTGEYGNPLGGRQPGEWSQDSTGVAGAAEAGDRFGDAMSSVELSRSEDDDDLTWALTLVTVPGEDLGSVADAGMAYLGFAPGAGSVALTPPVAQAGAGIGMVPMQVG